MNPEPETTETERRPADLLWLLSCAAVTAIATFVRFFWLELKPLHHDEGVNGYFLTSLFRSGEYKYDPANYHGPDLYYIALAFTKAFGLNTWSVRASVAVFGVLTVALAFWLRRHIGRTGALLAAFLLALSPGMTFISRYFIHEMLFVFLSFAIVLSIVLFIERARAGAGAIAWLTLLLLVCFLPSALNLADVLGGLSTELVWTLRIVFFAVEAALVYYVVRMLLSWRDGRPIYLLLASASVVLLAATKETGFITVGTMAIAAGCVWAWMKIDASAAVTKNRFGFGMAFSVLALLTAAAENKRIREGFEAVYENFKLAETETQLQLFWVIVGLCVAAFATWVLFVVLSRRGVGTELESDSQLNWKALLGAFGAADTEELIFAKTSVGGVIVLVVWFFVRIGVAMLVGWKSEKGAGAALDKIELTKIDWTILVLGVAMLAVSAFLWMRRRGRPFPSEPVMLYAAAAVVFLYVGALFFSSFFTFPEGISRAFEAYAIWTRTGNTDHTQNGTLAYVRWGMIIESPLLVLSALGTLIAFYKARHRFAMFAGMWAFGLFLAYTIIPYKTPWLALSFLLPMAVVAGYGLNELFTARQIPLKVLGAVLTIAGGGILAYQTYDINLVRFDSDAMPYIYAHTRREFVEMVNQIEYYSQKSGKGRDTKIEVMTPDYWPMPWYMNEHPEAIFQGKAVDANGAELIVAKKGDQDGDIVNRYAMRYRVVGQYPLRPGVELLLLVRNDLADSDTKDVYEFLGEPVEVR